MHRCTPNGSPARSMEYPTEQTIDMMSHWIQETECITWTGRTANAGKLVHPFDLFRLCVQEHPVWFFEYYRYVPAKGGPGSRAPAWKHVRDHVLMPALSEVRAALGVSDEVVEEKKDMKKKETRRCGASSLKALIGWEWSNHAPNRSSSSIAQKQAALGDTMPEDLVSCTDALDTPVELVPAERQQMSLVATAADATESAPQVYLDAPSVDADGDRCSPYETCSDVNEPDYEDLFAAEKDATRKTGEAAPPKGHKRKARHVVDCRPLTRSRV